MRKLSILAAATFALSLVGCANTSKARDAEEPSNEDTVWQTYHERASEDREDAPTVYDDDVTGDSGQHSTVTTGDGKKWDIQEEPHRIEPQTPDTQEGDEATGGAGEVEADVEIIDEGPTDEAPQE